MEAHGGGLGQVVKMSGVRVVTGRVVNGTVILDGAAPPEGSLVTVYVEEQGEGFHLDAQSIRELLEAQAEIRQGRFVTAEELLRDLANHDEP